MYINIHSQHFMKITKMNVKTVFCVNPLFICKYYNDWKLRCSVLLQSSENNLNPLGYKDIFFIIFYRR